MSNDNGVAPVKQSSNKVTPAFGQDLFSQSIAPKKGVGTEQRSRRGEFEASGKHSNVGGYQDLTTKVKGLGKSRSNSSQPFFVPDPKLSGNTSTKASEKIQRRAQSTLGSYSQDIHSSDRWNSANQGDKSKERPILEAIKKYGFEAAPDFVSHNNNFGLNGPNKNKVGSAKNLHTQDLGNDAPRGDGNVDPTHRSRASSEPPSRRLVFLRHGEESVFTDKGKGPTVLQTQGVFGEVTHEKGTPMKKKSSSKKDYSPVKESDPNAPRKSVQNQGLSPTTTSGTLPKNETAPTSQNVQEKNIPVRPSSSTVRPSSSTSFVCKSVNPSNHESSAKGKQISPVINKTRDSKTALQEAHSSPKKTTGPDQTSGHRSPYKGIRLSPNSSPGFPCHTCSALDQTANSESNGQKKNAAPTEQSENKESTNPACDSVCGGYKKSPPKDQAKTEDQAKEEDANNRIDTCAPIHEAPVCPEQKPNLDCNKSPPSSPPRPGPVGIRVRKTKKKGEKKSKGKDRSSPRLSPSPSRCRDPKSPRSKSSDPTFSSPQSRRALKSKSKSQTNLKDNCDETPPRRQCPEGIKGPPCKERRRPVKDPFANWFCRPRRRKPREDFFGSIAQAFGIQLSSIACRKRLYSHFPGMTGLYIPDIGMDSLFLPPAEEEEEDEREEHHRRKKRPKSPDSDSEATLQLQSKDENSVSRQFKQEHKAGSSDSKKPPSSKGKVTESLESQDVEKDFATLQTSSRGGSQRLSTALSGESKKIREEKRSSRGSTETQRRSIEPKRSFESKKSSESRPQAKRSLESLKDSEMESSKDVPSEPRKMFKESTFFEQKSSSHVGTEGSEERRSSRSKPKSSLRPERSFESRKSSELKNVVSGKSLDSVRSEPRGAEERRCSHQESERSYETRKSEDHKGSSSEQRRFTESIPTVECEEEKEIVPSTHESKESHESRESRRSSAESLQSSQKSKKSSEEPRKSVESLRTTLSETRDVGESVHESRQSVESERSLESSHRSKKSNEEPRKSVESLRTILSETRDGGESVHEPRQSVESKRSLESSHRSKKVSDEQVSIGGPEGEIVREVKESIEKIESLTSSTTPEGVTPLQSPMCQPYEAICEEIVEESSFKMRATVHSRKENMTVNMEQFENKRNVDRSCEKRPPFNRRSSQRPPLEYRQHGRIGSRKSTLEKTPSPVRVPSKKSSLENRLSSRKKSSSRWRYESKDQIEHDESEPVTEDQVSDDDDETLVSPKTSRDRGKYSKVNCDEWMGSTLGKTVLQDRKDMLSEEHRPSGCGKYSKINCDEWMRSTLGKTVLQDREDMLSEDRMSVLSRPTSQMEEIVTDRELYEQTTESEDAHHKYQRMGSFDSQPPGLDNDLSFARDQEKSPVPVAICSSEEDTRTLSCEDIPYSTFDEEQRDKSPPCVGITVESRKRLASGYDERTILISSSRNSMSPSSECSGYRVKIKRWKDGSLTDAEQAGLSEREDCKPYGQSRDSPRRRGDDGNTRCQSRLDYRDPCKQEDTRQRFAERHSMRRRQSDWCEREAIDESGSPTAPPRKSHYDERCYEDEDSMPDESEDRCMDPSSKWLGSRGQKSTHRPQCGETPRHQKGISIRLRTHSTDDSESECMKSKNQSPPTYRRMRPHSVKGSSRSHKRKKESCSRDKESEMLSSESNSHSLGDESVGELKRQSHALSRSSSSKNSQFLSRSQSGKDREEMEKYRDNTLRKSSTYGEADCEDPYPQNQTASEQEHHSSVLESIYKDECQNESNGKANTRRSPRDNESSDDVCKEKSVQKIKGTITYRCSSVPDDFECSPNSKTTTVAIQNGTVKMVSSPKGVKVVRCKPNEIDNSSMDESRSVTPTNVCKGLLSGSSSKKRPKPRSDSFLSDSCMERYERDAQYIKDRQRRLKNSEMCKKRSDESNGSDEFLPNSDYLCQQDWVENPIPAPRMRLVLRSSGGHGGYCRRGTEPSIADEQMARQRYMGTYRSRSNSAKREYKQERCGEGKIDIFGQVITPEQPFQLQEKHMFVSSSGNKDTSETVDTSNDDDYDKTCNHRPSKSANKIIISTDELGYFKEEECFDIDKCTHHSRKTAHGGTSNSKDQDYLASSDDTGMSLASQFLSLKRFFLPANENGDDFGGDESAMQPRSVPMVLHSRRESARPKLSSHPMEIHSVPTVAGQNAHRQESAESNMYGGHFHPGTDMFDHTDDFDEFGSLIPVARNKNCSSSAEGDRNSSSGGGVLYTGYAYTSGVIDTLRLLDVDNVSSSPSVKHSPPSTDNETSSVRATDNNRPDDNLTRIAKSLPFLAPASKHSDDAIEFIRQNSLRALLYASTMSTMGWPAYSLITGPFARRGRTPDMIDSQSPGKITISSPRHLSNSPTTITACKGSNSSDNIDESANKNITSRKRHKHKLPTAQREEQGSSLDTSSSESTLQGDRAGAETFANTKEPAKQIQVKRQESARLDENSKNCKNPEKRRNSHCLSRGRTLLDSSLCKSETKPATQDDSSWKIRRIHLDKEEEDRLRNAIFQKLNADPTLLSLPLYFKESDLNLTTDPWCQFQENSDTTSTISSDFEPPKHFLHDTKSMGDFVEGKVGELSASDKVKIFVLTASNSSHDDKVSSCNEDDLTSSSENCMGKTIFSPTKESPSDLKLCTDLINKSIKIFDNGNEEFRILTRNADSDGDASEAEMDESYDSDKQEDHSPLDGKEWETMQEPVATSTINTLYHIYNNRHEQLKKVYESTGLSLERPTIFESPNTAEEAKVDPKFTDPAQARVGQINEAQSSPLLERSFESIISNIKLNAKLHKDCIEETVGQAVRKNCTSSEDSTSAYGAESECKFPRSRQNLCAGETSVYKPMSPCDKSVQVTAESKSFESNQINTQTKSNQEEIPKKLIEELSSLCKCGWDILNRIKTESDKRECDKCAPPSNDEKGCMKSVISQQEKPKLDLNHDEILPHNQQETQGEMAASAFTDWAVEQINSSSKLGGGDSNNSVHRLQRVVITPVKDISIPTDTNVCETSRFDANQSRISSCGSDAGDFQQEREDCTCLIKADHVPKTTSEGHLEIVSPHEKMSTPKSDVQIPREPEQTFDLFQSLIDDKVKVFFDRALQRWRSPDQKRCSFLGENNNDVANKQLPKSPPREIRSVPIERKNLTLPSVPFPKRESSSSSQSLTSTIVGTTPERCQVEDGLVVLTLPAVRKDKPGDQSKSLKEQLIAWLKCSVPNAMSFAPATAKRREKNRHRKGKTRTQSDSRVRKKKQSKTPKRRPSSSSSVEAWSESSQLLNTSCTDYFSDSLLNHNASRSDDEAKNVGHGTRRSRRRNPPRQREASQRRQSTPVAKRNRPPQREQKVNSNPRQASTSKVGKSPETSRKMRAQSEPGTSRNKGGKPKGVAKQQKSAASRPIEKDKAKCFSGNEGKKKKEVKHTIPVKVNENEKKNKSKAVRTFNTIGISRVANALQNAPKAHCHHMSFYLESTADDELAENANPQDFDSRTECETFESCLLTPIKEESTSFDSTKPSDFDTFVSECTNRLLDITSTQSKSNGRLVKKSKSDSEKKMSPAIKTPKTSSKEKEMLASPKRRESKDESSVTSDDSSPISSDFFTKVMNAKKPMMTRCMCEGSSDRDSEEVASFFRSSLPINFVQKAEEHIKPPRFRGPFKSTFLRNEMTHAESSSKHSRSMMETGKPEDVLMRQYSGFGRKSSYRDVMSSAHHFEDRNYNRKKIASETTRILHSIQYTNPTVLIPEPGMASHIPPGKLQPPYPLLYYNYTEMDYRSKYLKSKYSDFNDYLTNCRRYRSAPKQSGSDEWKYDNVHSADVPKFSDTQGDFMRKNWNESANNGNDTPTSNESSGDDDPDMEEDEAKKETTIPKPTSRNQRTALAVPTDRLLPDMKKKDSRGGRVSEDNNYVAHISNPSCDERFCHSREQGCVSYDFLNSRPKNSRLSNFAAKNINGSGNMFGRPPHSEDDLMAAARVFRNECSGDSDDDFTSAVEETLHYASSNKTMPRLLRKEDQEMDDTCNHRDPTNFTIGDGPIGQFDAFARIPREDLLMSMSPMDDDRDAVFCYPQELGGCKRPMDRPQPQGAGHDNKPSRMEREFRPSLSQSQLLDKAIFAGRSCCGQGDIINKRAFTHWYTDDEGNDHKVQRRVAVPTNAGSLESHSEAWEKRMRAEGVASGVNELDEDEEEDLEEDDDEEGDEDEEDDGEDLEDDDDDDEDDDGDVDIDDEEQEMDKKMGCAGKETHKSNKSAQDVEMLEGSKSTITRGDKHMVEPMRQVRDISQNKQSGGGPRANGLMSSHFKDIENKIVSRKRSAAQDKPTRVKGGPGHQKFSMDQIKVPAIEKERVRFACDENGDWAEIGRGSYGCVYLGLLDGVIEVAIKDFYESSSWDLVIHEARMLMFLQDTAITPKFYGLRRRFDITKQPSEYCIIMEYFGDGRTLFNVMSDKMSLTGDEWMDIVGQLVAGLRLIHRKNVLINDLKADNILIDLTGGRKIIRYIDVGMATYKQGLTFQLPQDQMSKYNFLAPEVREGARTTTRSDIYSLGYMLDQMCRLADVALGGLKKLVTKCMEKNPARRPDVDDIVSQVHRFIASKAAVKVIGKSSPQEQFLLTNSI